MKPSQSNGFKCKTEPKSEPIFTASCKSSAANNPIFKRKNRRRGRRDGRRRGKGRHKAVSAAQRHEKNLSDTMKQLAKQSKHKSSTDQQLEELIDEKQLIPIDVLAGSQKMIPRPRPVPQNDDQWNRLFKQYSSEYVDQTWQPLSATDCEQLYRYARRIYERKTTMIDSR